MRYRSRDGLCLSADPNAVALWDSIGDQMATEQGQCTAALRAIGVKAAHPDDGWVNRERNTVHFEYPAFNDGVSVGDLIALGRPRSGYRLVRCTRIEHTGYLIPMTYHHFKDTGQRFPEPARKRRWQRGHPATAPVADVRTRDTTGGSR
ncbi:MAG TPA: hypothetical protein VHZ96_26280 [Frankiaceae bacterium]|jgi:hypothetical protein|nr:hypothetical protein [Frankiaceae bacterium]